MLTIYKAIAVDVAAIHSGTSKPCLMTLADDNGQIVGEYVVKVFKQNNLFHTNKEVYGSILAEHFDFNTPKAVLAKVGQGIIDILNQSGKYKGEDLRKGIYFATTYIENALDYSKAAKLRIEDWEVENIFAFDVLIRNSDRRNSKPNLFYKDREVYLIDHELTLATALLDKSFNDMLNDRQKYWQFLEYEKANGEKISYLFLNTLRERNKDKGVTFDTFAEYLRTFDVDILDEYQQQLQNLGYDTENYYAIKTYLTDIKQHSGLFIQLLKDLIA